MSEIDISSELSKTTKNNETEHGLPGGGHWGCWRAVEWSGQHLPLPWCGGKHSRASSEPEGRVCAECMRHSAP